MKIREYFGELKTPVQIAAEYIATAYFNGEITEIERDDLQNYVKQCNINPYELVFHATKEIIANTLQSFTDIARDYPILNVNWLNVNIDRAKIEGDLHTLLNIGMSDEVLLAEGCAIEELPRPNQSTITQDFDKMRQRNKAMDPMDQALYPDVLR